MVDRRTLAAAAVATGDPVRTAANLPVDLNDPDSVWFVERGAVDVFVIERRNGQEAAAPQHLLHADAGRLLLGVAPGGDEDEFGLIAKGLQNTVLRRLPTDLLHTLDAAAVAEQVDRWIAATTAALARLVESRPRPDVLLEPGAAVAAQPGVVAARRGVVWLPATVPGGALYMDIVQPEDIAGPDADAAIPLTRDNWISLLQPAAIGGRTTRQLAIDGVLVASVRRFHALAFAVLQLDRLLALADDANLQRAQARHRRTDADRAAYDLFNLLNERPRAAPGSQLASVLAAIGRHQGVTFAIPHEASDRDGALALRDLLDASGVRCRRLRLRRDERWWSGDGGALLGFRAGSGQPVALLPDPFGGYWEVDAAGSRNRVTAGRAADLEPEALMFYTPLPHAPCRTQELVRLSVGRAFGDLVRFTTTGFLGSLLLLLPALLVGLIVNRVIPNDDRGLLYPAVAGLVTFAVLGALLHIVQGTALMRLEGRITARIEAALWDRILRLPARFLRRHPVGDIAMRGMAFRTLRDTISGAVADSLLAVVFLLPAFLLMIWHDLLLGGASLVFGLLSLATLVVLARRQVPWHRRVLSAGRKLSGLLFQFVNGVAKIRAGSAEPSAFANWARAYREQKKAEMGLGVLNEHLLALSTALPMLASALLLAIAAPAAIAVGDFLLIFAALSVFQAAVVRLGASFSAVASVVPACELAAPILSEQPAAAATGEAVGELHGEIRFDRVSFRYHADGPPVLQEVSIHAAPGEFVAIVGESGSGKSTLFRIALGIEVPSSGAVYYDGRDMARLNTKQLCSRIGAVPQETVLMPENILDNIAGDAAAVDTAAVWQAARLAAVDREIARMPMGMATSVGVCAATLSGGEMQRVMIAAALVESPRIVMLDESTNWLDNGSQAAVMDNLEQLSATRLVIAHRLSTLQHADRIYVLQAGKVVQQGSYDELAAVDGVFRDLVRRQTL